MGKRAGEERWEKKEVKKRGCNQKTEEDRENDEPQTNLHFYMT